MRRQGGFSLIEIILASVLTVLLIVPLVFMFQQSLHQTDASIDEITAIIMAREVVENLATIKAIIGTDPMKNLSTHKKADAYVDITNLRLPFLADDKFSQIHTKMYLSPAPDGFRRLIKVYEADRIPGNNYDKNMLAKECRVLIEWKTHGAAEFNRRLEMICAFGRDEVFKP